MADDVLERVRKRVAEVLAVPVDTIEPTSRLMTDLGAESLDLVELIFLLEQEFNVRISRDDLSLSAQLGLPDSEIHKDEILTPPALELLRQRFPDAAGVLKEGANRRQLASLLTVEEVARAMRQRLARS